MSAQAVQAFPIENSNNSWKKEVLEFLNKRLDQIAEQTTMEKIEDITGAIFRNKSEILGQMTLGFIKKKYPHLLDQEYCNCPKCNKNIKFWNKNAVFPQNVAGSNDFNRLCHSMFNTYSISKYFFCFSHFTNVPLKS